MAFTRIRLALRTFVKSQSARVGQVRVRRIRPRLEILEDRLAPATGFYLVNQANDAGNPNAMGTLSWAIAQSNLWATDPQNTKHTPATINFTIPGQKPTINVTAALPAINAPVVIDGDNGLNPTAAIININGNKTPGVGLMVSSGSVTIDGPRHLQFWW